MFTEVPGETVVLLKGGVYRQAKVFVWQDRLFAQYGGGFIGLSDGGVTTVPNVRWDALTYEACVGRFGRLVPQSAVVRLASAG